MSTLTTITMPFTEAVNAFNALLPHAPKSDDIHKVICGVHWAADGTLLATDRYTVGRYKPERAEFGGDEFQGATLPYDAVKWVAAVRPAKLSMGARMAPTYSLRFGFDSSAQIVRIELGYGSSDHGLLNVEASAVFETIDHTDYRGYPNVARLFPDESTQFGVNGPLNLKADFLARIGTAVKWLDDRTLNGCARFQFILTDNERKPGPVYVQVGDRFDALVQPNLLLR